MDRFDRTIQKRTGGPCGEHLCAWHVCCERNESTAGEHGDDQTRRSGRRKRRPRDTGQDNTGQDNTGQDNTGQDFANPQNLFQLRYQYRTAPGTDLKATIRTVTTDTLTLRADFTRGLGSSWKVAFRTDLPFIAKDPISSDHPFGD